MVRWIQTSSLSIKNSLSRRLITVFCLVTYWIDKFNVLRLYRKPANLSDEVPPKPCPAVLKQRRRTLAF